MRLFGNVPCEKDVIISSADEPSIIQYSAPATYEVGGDTVSFKTGSAYAGEVVLPSLACARWRFGTCSANHYEQLNDDGNPAWLGTESGDLHAGCEAPRADPTECPVIVVRSAVSGSRIVAYAPDGTRYVDQSRTVDQAKAVATPLLEAVLWPALMLFGLAAGLPAPGP